MTKQMYENYSCEFGKEAYFSLLLVVDRLCLIEKEMWILDMLAFNQYVMTYHNYEAKKHGPLSCFIRNKFGEKACEIITEMVMKDRIKMEKRIEEVFKHFKTKCPAIKAIWPEPINNKTNK